jgi:hypothetical protein
VLEVAPWSGDPLIGSKPDGGIRTTTFGPSGQGMITYLILEDQRRVDILDVLWIGRSAAPPRDASGCTPYPTLPAAIPSSPSLNALNCRDPTRIQLSQNLRPLDHPVRDELLPQPGPASAVNCGNRLYAPQRGAVQGRPTQFRSVHDKSVLQIRSTSFGQKSFSPCHLTRRQTVARRAHAGHGSDALPRPPHSTLVESNFRRG